METLIAMMKITIIFILLIGKAIHTMCAQDEKIYMTMLLSKVMGIRLPNDTIPRLYSLQLDPHLNAENFTFDGTSSTVFEVVYPTRDVTLHASHLLEIDKTYTRLVHNNGTNWKPISQRWNPVLQFYNVRFAHELPNGKYTIKLKWSGHVTPDFKGFYRSIVSFNTGDDEFMVASHFQPIAARNAFPCWDEPSLKAEFEISIKHDHNHTALSNMPVRSDTEADNNMLWTHFEKSPPMSTYLATFIVSDYANLINEHGNITFWTKQENLEDVRLSFELCQIVITAMEEYTGITYTLSKLDQVTIPQYSSAATEHWGIVSYMEKSITYNVENDGINKRDHVILLTIHELSHQWFGNLVTPAWWNDLWLSEAFAVYFSYKIVDQIFDDWHGMDLFVVEVVNEISFPADEWNRNHHPIKWEPESSEEIREMFGPITYRKGAAVLHMLEAIVSEEVFQDGIMKYLNKHQFGAVTTDDLWQALQESYQEKEKHPHLNIKEIMDPWVEQTGYPILNITREYRTGLTNVTQIDATDPETNHMWMIPITFTTRTQPDFGCRRPTHWMRRSNENLTLYGIDRDDWVILNVQQTGFYRVNYDYENWKRLADYLNTDNYHKIHVRNRAQLIWDLSYFSLHEEIYMELLIDVILYLHREINFLPWIPTIRIMERVYSVLINTPAYDIFEKLMLHLISNITDHVGFDNHQEESHLTTLARDAILPWACTLGHEGCRNAAARYLAGHLRNPTENPVPSSGQKWIYCNGLRGSNQTIWEEVMNAHLANPLLQPGFEFLGCTDNRFLIRQYLNLAIADNSSILTDQVSDAFYSIMSGPRENVDFTLDYFISHIDRIRHHFSIRDLSKQVDWIVSRFSYCIKNPDQYDKYQRFLTRQVENGKISHIEEYLKTARDTMAESERVSTLFHTLADKKPSLYDLIHSNTYSKRV